MLPNAFYIKEGEPQRRSTRISLRSSRSSCTPAHTPRPQDILDSDGGSFTSETPSSSSDDNSCDSFSSTDALQTRGRGKAKASRRDRSPSSSPYRPTEEEDEEDDFMARRARSIKENKAMLAKLLADLEPVFVKKPRTSSQYKPKDAEYKPKLTDYGPTRHLPRRSCVKGIYKAEKRVQTHTPTPKKARKALKAPTPEKDSEDEAPTPKKARGEVREDSLCRLCRRDCNHPL